MKERISAAIVCVVMVYLGAGHLYAQSAGTSVDAAGAEVADVAERPWSLSASLDALSAYEWRGYVTSGFSLQPEVTLDYAFPSLDIYADVWFDHSFAWGFGSYPKSLCEYESYNELDVTLGLDWKGLDFSLASYFTPLYGFDPVLDDKTTFALDATLGYTFGFGLGLHWSTLLSEPVEEGEKKPFSSYCELSYEGTFGGLDLSANVGAVPWYSPYIDWPAESIEAEPYVNKPDKFHFVKLSVGAGSTFSFSDDRFSVPVSINVMYNPTMKQWGVQLVAGFSFDTSF